MLRLLYAFSYESSYLRIKLALVFHFLQYLILHTFVDIRTWKINANQPETAIF